MNEWAVFTHHRYLKNDVLSAGRPRLVSGILQLRFEPHVLYVLFSVLIEKAQYLLKRAKSSQQLELQSGTVCTPYAQTLSLNQSDAISITQQTNWSSRRGCWRQSTWRCWTHSSWSIRQPDRLVAVHSEAVRGRVLFSGQYRPLGIWPILAILVMRLAVSLFSRCAENFPPVSGSHKTTFSYCTHSSPTAEISCSGSSSQHETRASIRKRRTGCRSGISRHRNSMRLRQTLNCPFCCSAASRCRTARLRLQTPSGDACGSRAAAEQLPLCEWAVISERHCSRDKLRSREFSTQFTERSTFAVHWRKSRDLKF